MIRPGNRSPSVTRLGYRRIPRPGPRMGRYGRPGPLGGSAGIRRPGRGFAEGDRRVYMQVHEPRGQALRLRHHPEHRHIDPAIDVVLPVFQGRKHPGIDEVRRSEEHTSELQSLMSISYAVFCLKKKKKKYTIKRRKH